MATSNQYDAVIIGAGIGGLTCGCYLARAGLKTLIIEQHFVAGGYCSSFTRGGFSFDVGVHYLGSCGDGRVFNKILGELCLFDKINLKRINPSDVVILPDFEVSVKNDCYETMEDLGAYFPKEKDAIIDFIEMVNRKNFLEIYDKFKNSTFKEMLDLYFKDHKLKAFFQVLLGNIGLPSSKVAAMTAIVMYRQFVFDGGYYPAGGMQTLPDMLLNDFKEKGGEIKFSCKAESLTVTNNRISAVTTDTGEVFHPKYVVSNSDPTRLFSMIDDKKAVPDSFNKKLGTLKTSISAFIVYLGLESMVKKYPSSAWYFNTYDVDKIYSKAFNNETTHLEDYVICTFPSLHDNGLSPKGCDCMSIIIAAPYECAERGFDWNNEKQNISEILIGRAKKVAVKELGNIKVKVLATPKTLERYTANSRGALYGWASTLDQNSRDIMQYQTCVDNLLMAGHWVTTGLGQGGISGVAHSGRAAAKCILKKMDMKLTANMSEPV